VAVAAWRALGILQAHAEHSVAKSLESQFAAFPVYLRRLAGLWGMESPVLRLHEESSRHAAILVAKDYRDHKAVLNNARPGFIKLTCLAGMTQRTSVGLGNCHSFLELMHRSYCEVSYPSVDRSLCLCDAALLYR
jgi:hypothetical protein